jgi:hypothetical protein
MRDQRRIALMQLYYGSEVGVREFLWIKRGGGRKYLVEVSDYW